MTKDELSKMANDVLADGKVDFGEATRMLGFMTPSVTRNEELREFKELLERVMEDGIITDEESAEVAAALRKLTERKRVSLGVTIRLCAMMFIQMMTYPVWFNTVVPYIRTLPGGEKWVPFCRHPEGRFFALVWILRWRTTSSFRYLMRFLILSVLGLVLLTTSAAVEPYAWRGFQLDEARHFFGKETVKEYLDHLHRLELNVLHWHLTDDQGWRLDVPGFPELVKYGAVRSSTPIPDDDHDKSAGDDRRYGPFFYTPADVREIVAYAAARGIRVVPEIEIPGHMRAFLAAHPEFSCTGDLTREAWSEWGVCEDVLCAGNEAAIVYYERVLDAVMEMFPSEFIHIGGDECPKKRWKACSKCQARIKALGLKDEEALQGWLTTRIVRHVTSRGRRAIGWDEILAGGDLPKETVVQCWRNPKYVQEAAARGHDVIASPWQFCYFTFAEGLPGDPYHYRSWTKGIKLPVEKVLRFDPCVGIPSELCAHVLGGECCVWSEYVHDREELDYKALNRLNAFAKVLNPARLYAPIPPLAVTNITLEIGLKRPFSVLHVSDSHLTRIDSRSDEGLSAFAKNRSRNGRELGEHYLDEAFAYARQRGLKVVHSGDVMEFASEANLEHAERLFHSADVIACPGNHEYWVGSPDDGARLRQTMRPRLKPVFGAEASISFFCGVTFFAFDNACGAVSPSVAAMFDEAVTIGRPIVLVCHVPLSVKGLDTTFPFLKGTLCGSSDQTTRDFVERARREPLVRAALCGHLHTSLVLPFSPTANQFVAAPLFGGSAREICFR